MTYKDNDKKQFDMYHFLSRKDIALTAAIILFLLLWALYHFFGTVKAV
jgi:hypothetical protein